MTRAQILAQFEQMGIRTKNGQVCKADLMKILGSGKGAADIEPHHFKVQFLECINVANSNLSLVMDEIWEAQEIAKEHDPSGIEKNGLLKISELLKEVKKELEVVFKACKEDRKA
jgi:hypothetical protein